MNFPDLIQTILIYGLPVIFAITLHEAAHGYVAHLRGDNTAWTWEHQAMTRARFCLGAPELKTRFDAVRASVINAKRDVAALQQEIVAMRDKMRAAHPVKPDLFDVKHSAGGMVDVEFAVQFWCWPMQRNTPHSWPTLAILLCC